MEYLVNEYDHIDYMKKFQINSLLAKVLAFYQFNQDKLTQIFGDVHIEDIVDNAQYQYS